MSRDIRSVLSAAVPYDAGSPDLAAAWRSSQRRRRRRAALALSVTGGLAVAAILVVGVGSDGRQVSTTPASERQDSILALRGGRLVELSPDGATMREVVASPTSGSEGGGVSVSPDGTTALVTTPLVDPFGEAHCPGSDTRSGFGVRLVDLRSGSATDIGLAETASGVVDPTFSPDGTQFAYVEYQCQPIGPSTLDSRQPNALVVRDLAGDEVFRLALPLISPDDGSHVEIIDIAGWDPDGQSLVAAVQHEPGVELWRIDVQAASPPTRLPVNEEVRAISLTPMGSTGRWLATRSSTGTAPKIVEYDADTGAVLDALFEWTSLPRDAGGEVVASDSTGRSVLLIANLNGGPQVLYRWSEGDAQPTKVADGVSAAEWLASRASSGPDPHVHVAEPSGVRVRIPDDWTFELSDNTYAHLVASTEEQTVRCDGQRTPSVWISVTELPAEIVADPLHKIPERPESFDDTFGQMSPGMTQANGCFTGVVAPEQHFNFVEHGRGFDVSLRHYPTSPEQVAQAYDILNSLEVVPEAKLARPTAKTTARAPQEDVIVFVQNASGQALVGANTANRLRSLGYPIAGVANATRREGNLVQCRRGTQKQARRLAERLDAPARIGELSDPRPSGAEDADCVVTMGA